MDSKCEANGNALDIELGSKEHASCVHPKGTQIDIHCATTGNAEAINVDSKGYAVGND